MKKILVFLMILSTLGAYAQTDTIQKKAEEKPKKWYDKINLRGYAQVRYNRLLETNPDLKCDQCDRSWGDKGGFFIRRARLIFSGNVHDRVYIYIQPDLASSASSTGLHFAQLRDAYFDLALDKEKTSRLRFGQSKIPFGFENLQSSQNRLPLDRNDALNSALANERDLGLIYYWAPAKIRERFSYLVSSGLKGSGDYGVFALGMYNGQTANKPEANNEPHYVARISYPIEIGTQIIEPGIQAYNGKVDVTSDLRSPKVKGEEMFLDQRAAGSFVLYPQPFGIQAEWNIGRGPEFNPDTKTIESRQLEGGYVQVSYQIKVKEQVIFPFARTQYYIGGKKHELDARKYRVREHEFGIEWQPIPNFELVTMYTISDRTFEDMRLLDNRQKGNLLRIQAQFNF